MEHEEAIVRLWGQLNRQADWHFDRAYWVYKDAVALGFDQICRKWNGPFGESPIANDCALLNHLLVVQNQRKKGLALEALQDLTRMADTSRCGIVGVVSPFNLKKKNIYDMRVLIQRMLLGEFEVMPTESASREIDSVCKLFENAGFVFGYKFQRLMAFGDQNFQMERQFAYLPNGMGEDARDWIESSEPIYVDDIDEVSAPSEMGD